MTERKIRPARLGDAAALTACIDEAYSIYAGRISDLPPVSEGIADDIERHHVCVAIDDQEIVGGLVLIEQDDHMVLVNVAVAPKAAGSGWGRALLNHAEATTRRLGYSEMRLSTHVAMPENVRLYEHLGWQETARAGNKVQMVKSVNR